MGAKNIAFTSMNLFVLVSKSKYVIRCTQFSSLRLCMVMENENRMKHDVKIMDYNPNRNGFGNMEMA